MQKLPADYSSFSQTSELLRYCDVLLVRHQIDLMHGDHATALLHFEQLYELRNMHLAFMQKRFLPLYELHPNGTPQGGRPQYFIREKDKVHKNLYKYVRFFSRLVQMPGKIKLDLVRLFDEYVFLKDLLDHHDTRERIFLLPRLDDHVKGAKREQVLKDYLKEQNTLLKRWEV